jgi:O-antigen/teichoic acid export membrane protein
MAEREPPALADGRPSGEESLDRVEAEDLLSTSQAGPAAVRGGTMRVSSFAIGSLLSVGAAALLFRHLGVVNTGRYTIAMSLGALVAGFTDLGLTAIGMREFAVLSGERRARVSRNLLGIRLALTVVGVLSVSVFAFIAYGAFLSLGVLVAGVGVLLTNTQTTLAVPLMAMLRLGWVSALDLTRQLVSAVSIVVLVVLGARLLPFLTVPAVAAAVVLAPTALLARRHIPLRPSFDTDQWRALLAPVLTYSAAVAAATLYFRVAIVLVSLLSTSRELGYFSVPFRVVEVLFAIPGLLVGAAFPIFARAARDDPQRLGYALSRVFEVSLIVGAWVSLSLAVGARLAIEIIGGPKFLPAASILAIQGIGLGASFVSTVWGYGMLSLHLHRLILLFSLVSLALATVVVSLLVILDGAQGAAIGTAAVEVGVAIGSGLLLVRGHPHLRPRLTVLPKVALAAALGATPMLATGLPTVIQLALASVIYGGVLVCLRALPAELRDLLPMRPGRGEGQA